MTCLRAFASLLAAFMLCSAAKATDIYCVGTDAQLNNALVLASVNAHVYGSDAVVKIQKRAQPYVINTLPAYDYGAHAPPYRGISLLGGYTGAGCSDETRTARPANTMLSISAKDQYGTFSLVGDGDVSVDAVSISADYGIELRISSEHYGNSELAKTKIQNSVFSAPVRLGNNNPSNEIYEKYYVTQSVFENVVDGCGLQAQQGLSENNVYFYIANSIFFGNQKGICGDGQKSRIYLYNNITWNNSDGIDDSFPGGAPVWNLVDNIVQSVNDFTPATQAGTLSSDPLFVDPANGDFHLKQIPKSPAIDSGSNSLPGGLTLSVDVDGNARPLGPTIDRGPYESPVGANPNTIFVDTNSDQAQPPAGKTSLRGAILAANQNGSSQLVKIKFNIPSQNCVSDATKIVLSTPLPAITRSISIDGYSQFGAAFNTASFGFNAKNCIRIAAESSQTFAFLVPAAAGSDVQLSVSGLNIYGFISAINLSGGGQHKITGNDFTPSTGSAPNSVNVRVSGTASVLLGGSEADKRNLLVGAADSSVILDSNQNVVIGNIIGAGRGGIYASGAGNKVGVRVVSGGLNSIFGNTISGNVDYGVELVGSSHDSYLESNLVGENDGGACAGVCDQDHPPSLPNGKAGFRIDASSSKNWIFSNEIAYNPVGVCIGSTRDAMINNRIHDNAILGVDLDGTGGAQCQGLVDQNDNDVSASPTYPNAGQNYPVLLWSGGQDGSGLADGKVHGGSVRGQLPSKNGNFTVYLFASDRCGAQGYGEGSELVGSGKVVIADAAANNGLANFEFDIQSTLLLEDRVMTAQARDDETGNISEFSRCISFARDTQDPATDDRIFVDSIESAPLFSN